MTEPTLIELAKRGDAKAIANLLNRSLQLRGITVEANLTHDCLNLLLHSDRLLNQQSLIDFLHKGLTNLHSDMIKTVQIYAQQIDQDFPDWSAKLILITTSDQDNIQELKEAAEQGDINALTLLMNIALSSANLTVKLKLDDQLLKIIVESNIVPNDKTALSQIYLQLEKLNLTFIENVYLYGRQKNSDFISWTREFALDDDLNFLLGKKQPQAGFFSNLQAFDLASVFPYKDALGGGLYQSNQVKLLLFFGFFPWAVTLLATRADLRSVAWILGIYYASIWGVVLYHVIKPEKISVFQIFVAIIFTVFMGIPILLVFQKIPPFSLLYSLLKNRDVVLQLIGFILGVGLLEESCKALPIYLFILRSEEVIHPLNSAFYGAMSGLGFAITEGVQYSLGYAVGLADGQINIGSYVLINTVRFVSLPLIHAIWAGIVGYFVGLAAINPSRKYTIIFIGITISALLHGTYNTFSNGLIGLSILAFSILLFVAYLRRSQLMVDEMHQAEMQFQKKKRKIYNN
ncbi:MAG TPA: PrsW family glutamic-type intramembrane protease [Allocoleopsis sp.]